MADPEQIYSEVLTEEQGKGVSAPVAEGRAKAARARAEAGSPHPKEPKWWPGSQPHLEGGGDGAAPAEEVVEEAAQDEPAEVPVSEETPAATEEVQAPQVPQEQPAPPEPAPPAAADEPAAAAPAAAASEAPAAAKPSGVIHGTTTGTRLRPEDEATTEAQFQGQMDMYARRKLIDELVGTGVPVVSAAETGEKRSPVLALLYLLIPIMAIAFLLANNESTPAAAEGEGGGGGESGAITLTAANVQFDTDQLTLPAGEEASVEFHNEDSAPHNLAIYNDESASEDLFVGQIIDGGSSTTYQIDPIEAGEYYFQCDVHPSMNGTLTAE